MNLMRSLTNLYQGSQPPIAIARLLAMFWRVISSELVLTHDLFSNGTNVYFCPRYFTNLRTYPEAGENCPTMSYRLSSTSFQLHSDAVENQFGILIHELAHIYHPNKAWSHLEIYDLNAIINAYPTFRMSAEHQLNNANNYAYYAICKYALPCAEHAASC